MKYTYPVASIRDYKHVLEQYGVCVIPGIIDMDELVDVRTRLWHDISHAMQGRLDINNRSTWNSLSELHPIHGMLIHHYGIGHMQSVWNIRQNKRIGDIFGSIYGVHRTELCTSMDGISVSLPPEVTGEGWYDGVDWLHLDHGPNNKHKCIQGFVNLYDVAQGDATLRVLLGSHKHTPEFYNSLKEKNDRDWLPLTCEQVKWYKNRGCEDVCITAPAGSLVLWDSHTVHQGMEPQIDRKDPNIRATIYICMRPKSEFTTGQRHIRMDAFKSLHLTNHWGTTVFDNNPNNTDISQLNLLSHPVLSEYGMSLI